MLMTNICCKVEDKPRSVPNYIYGTLVLKKKNVMDFPDLGASFLDVFYEFFRKGVSLQLISTVNGQTSRETFLENWASNFTSTAAQDESTFDITFQWEQSLGAPGAFLIRNNHRNQFFLKTLTLRNVPGYSDLYFVCDSWVYPSHRYKYDRVFFANKAYLPRDTPQPLKHYREKELKILRGNGKGPLKEWDRIYDYAYYNDLGHPEKGNDHARPILGGSEEYPYPRRGRTGRRPNKTDPKTESRLFLLNLNFYVPRDERFNQIKFSDFIGYALKSLGQVLVTEMNQLFDKTRNEFDTFQDVMNMYEGGIKLAKSQTLHQIRERVPWELMKELLRSDADALLKFPVPDVIKEDRTAWRTDEEFGREMLAGVNPVIISRLKEFPPKSNLNVDEYGNQDSIIKREDIEKNMNGISVEKALRDNKLYILDHHDTLMPYLRRINTDTTTKTYATRTLLLLQDDGTLKPLAIELSLPHEDGDSHGALSEVFTPPATDGVEKSIWDLAKAYAAVNDSGYHQLISHWLLTHAVTEPIVIATNRHLSVMHPIYKLLKPHFRDTIHINALARQVLINAGGVLERTVYPARYAMEMSSVIYKNWNFTKQALPVDLIERGVAIPDPEKPYGLRLLIEDYPFAVDGLEIWSAIEAWVTEYCDLYYPTNDLIKEDSEIQSWWKDVREGGHGDLKDEPWWPKMETRGDMIQSCTIIIWVASALHAAVNFGQYPYAGYLPNRPTVSRRFMPKPGSAEYAELETNPNGVLLKTITAQLQTLLGVSLIEMLSMHSSDEIYLGQRDTPHWTADEEAKEAFERFRAALVEIEARIMDRNNDKRLRNRSGPVKVPYMLLYPNTTDDSRRGGLTGKGIPNSVSI